MVSNPTSLRDNLLLVGAVTVFKEKHAISTPRLFFFWILNAGSIGEVSVVRRKQVQRNINGSGHAAAPSGGPTLGSSSGKERRYAMKTIYVTRMTKARLQEFENEVAILQRL